MPLNSSIEFAVERTNNDQFSLIPTERKQKYNKTRLTARYCKEKNGKFLKICGSIHLFRIQLDTYSVSHKPEFGHLFWSRPHEDQDSLAPDDPQQVPKDITWNF